MHGTLASIVGLETRRFLASLRSPRGLDERCLELLESALEKARPVAPGPMVLRLAQALGAARERALAAASFAELFYVTCSLTDDIQDGDADESLPGLPLAEQLNVAMQLLCLTVVAAGRLAGVEPARSLGTRHRRDHGGAAAASVAAAPGPGRAATSGARDAARGLELMVEAFFSGAAMLRGQRLELSREGWSVATYRRVAELSAGRQLEVYFRAACAAAGEDCASLLRLAAPLGAAIQIRADEAVRDERWERLPKGEARALAREVRRRVQTEVERLPAALRPVVERVLRDSLPREPAARTAAGAARRKATG